MNGVDPNAHRFPSDGTEDSPSVPDADGGLFPATAWSVIIGAADGASPKVLADLDRLAHAYWRPLFLFVRQRGQSPEEAADSVQGFFEHLLSREFLKHVRPEAGRFRTFLLSCFVHWLRDQWVYASAAKRGNGERSISLDGPEPPPELEFAGEAPPGDSFDRIWAKEIIAMASARLATAWSGRREVFEALKGTLGLGPEPGEPYAKIASRLGMTEGSVKKAAFDLRQNLGHLIRREVRRTVRSEQEVEDELRHLLRLLRH